MKFLNHCRTDDIGVFNDLPMLLVRMGMDQHAFDAIKWYDACGGKPALKTSTATPFLSYWNEDSTQLVHFKSTTPLGMVAADGLLKYRLLLACKERETFYTLLLAGKNHKIYGWTDIMRYIHGFLSDSQTNRVLQGKSPAQMQSALDAALQRAEQVNNPRIWKAIVDPDPLITQPPSHYIRPCSGAQMYLCLGVAMDAWQETPGAMQYLLDYCMRTSGNLDYDSFIDRY